MYNKYFQLNSPASTRLRSSTFDAKRFYLVQRLKQKTAKNVKGVINDFKLGVCTVNPFTKIYDLYYDKGLAGFSTTGRLGVVE